MPKDLSIPPVHIGQQFGRLTVLAFAGRKSCHPLWLCRCTCGTEKTVGQYALRNAQTVSCGCHRRRQNGRSKTPEYRAWLAMKDRCYNPENVGYQDYGGRGISVYPEWLDSFEAFFNAVGPRPDGKHAQRSVYALERKDNDKGYTPDNVEWATQHAQSRNKRINRQITFQGRTQILKDWAREYGVCCSTLAYRLAHGWEIERALTAPLRSRHTTCA